jgi:leucine-zipper of insertion element IS481
MILHANAALSRRQRERLIALVLTGTTITAATLVVGCSRQTASKWIGLAERSSRPRRSPRRTPAAVEQAVLRARRELAGRRARVVASPSEREEAERTSHR